MKGVNKRGFSLIEILLVVVILLIIAGLTVPNLSATYQKFQVEKTAEDIAYLMRYAQSRAITRNRDLRLEFNDPKTQFWLKEKDPKSNQYDLLPGRLGQKREVSQAVRIEIRQPAINFYKDGTIGKISFDLCRRKKNCLTVTTKIQRGDVQIITED